MPSKWKVTRNIINNKSMFAVYRLKDALALDHSGNREYAMEYMDYMKHAVEIAEKLYSQN